MSIQQDFVNKCWPYAKEAATATGIDPVFILAQAALESGWGKSAPGNMYFGIKDTDGVNGNEQLVTTSEYLKSPNVKFPVIISITKAANGLWKYIVKDYFRKYNTPADSFKDHVKFFFKNKRYATALTVKSNPYKFATEIAKAGYATAPDYAKTLHLMINGILRCIPKIEAAKYEAMR